MDSKISRHFSFEEFTKSDTASRYHINNAITDWEVRDNIVALVENVLEPLREAWGGPLFINSGYRCKELNEKVGGVETSQHCKGQASDVVPSTRSMTEPLPSLSPSTLLSFTATPSVLRSGPRPASGSSMSLMYRLPVCIPSISATSSLS